ncbi:hypothetical protein [Streptomyces sviceus]|uniref:hypothetical protein n=1 Tax=Streptomyces sviceus TaxID=285530 RepID=UPI003334042D
MGINTYKRRLPALVALGLGSLLPLTVGVAPAYAQPQYQITKTHSDSFVRGGQATYVITVRNTGDETPAAGTSVRDTLPTGLTAVAASGGPLGGNGNPVSCLLLDGGATVDCGASQLEPGQGIEIFVTVTVAADAPCQVTNVARLEIGGSPAGSASDPTTITGSGCGNGGGSGSGGSLLPINLSGILPLFNNISTNSNIHSPSASNSSHQDFALNP